MELERIKQEEDAQLCGVVVNVVFDGGVPTRVCIKDKAGNYLEIGKYDYGMQVLIPKRKKVFCVSGTANNVHVNKQFDSNLEAEAFIQEWKGAFPCEEDVKLAVSSCFVRA